MSNRLLRNEIGIANIAEKNCAISKKDSLKKIRVTLKEYLETIYWLELLSETDYLTEKEFDSVISDCEEMRKVMSSTTRILNYKLLTSPYTFNIN